MCAYVCHSWCASNEVVDEGSHFVAIQGRRTGFPAWLLTRLGVAPRLSLAISAETLCVARGSFDGDLQRVVPLENISAIVRGREKPWRTALTIVAAGWAFGATLPFTVMWLAPAAMLAALVAAIGYYAVSDCLTLRFVEISGHVTTLQFQRSRVGDQEIDSDAVAYVVELSQALIENRKSQLAAAEVAS